MPSALRAASGRPGRTREEAEDLTPEERLDSVEKDIEISVSPKKIGGVFACAARWNSFSYDAGCSTNRYYV
jgi:hypothetical protein